MIPRMIAIPRIRIVMDPVCCFGWSPMSLICLLDNLCHDIETLLPKRLADRWNLIFDPICEKHDRWITRDLDD